MLGKAVANPLMLLLGVGRIRKTLPLKPLPNSLGHSLRIPRPEVLEGAGYSKAQLYRPHSDPVSGCASRWRRGPKYFGGVRGVGVSGFSVEFDWRGVPTLPTLPRGLTRLPHSLGSTTPRARSTGYAGIAKAERFAGDASTGFLRRGFRGGRRGRGRQCSGVDRGQG